MWGQEKRTSSPSLFNCDRGTFSRGAPCHTCQRPPCREQTAADAGRIALDGLTRQNRRLGRGRLRRGSQRRPPPLLVVWDDSSACRLPSRHPERCRAAFPLCFAEWKRGGVRLVFRELAAAHSHQPSLPLPPPPPPEKTRCLQWQGWRVLLAWGATERGPQQTRVLLADLSPPEPGGFSLPGNRELNT